MPLRAYGLTSEFKRKIDIAAVQFEGHGKYPEINSTSKSSAYHRVLLLAKEIVLL
jgi:hypothetical protein